MVSGSEVPHGPSCRGRPDTCATSVEGLYAAGDAATRELFCGGFTGGGSHNAAWTMSSGFWAGAGAAAPAAERWSRRGLGPRVGARVGTRTGGNKEGGGVIEIVSEARCTGCNICVRICPPNVFDAVPGGKPRIARQDDCQTCFT